MNVDLGIWSKLTKAVVALVVIAVLLLIGLCYLPLINENAAMRRDILRLESEIQKQDQIAQQLRIQVELLRNDPKTIERLAREKLGYARPNETIVHFETATNNNSGQ